MTPQPYWTSDDGNLTLYHGKFEDILPGLGLQPDLLVVDPPYQSTSLAWDRWPDGWPGFLAEHTDARAMWCFGSLRVFVERGHEFRDGGWKLFRDTVIEKTAGSAPAVDWFNCVHELAVLWYRGPWAEVHHETPVVEADPAKVKRNGSATRTAQPQHTGTYGPASKWTDNGMRLVPSVIKAPSMRGHAIHPTEKHTSAVRPLIRFGCPEGGLVLDPMAGSGSTLDAARQTGRRAVGIEWREDYVEAAARRLSATLALEFT